jgi:hypothetical protein
LIGISVFLLAKQLFKNNEASLVSALFVLIAPASLRLLNSFWKTQTALFFLSLFFYFLFKAQKQEKTKNFLLALVMLLLIFLSHKLVGFFALLLLLCFVFFESAFEKKVSNNAKNAAIVFFLSSIIVLLFFLSGQNGLQDFFSMFGLINATQSASANASLWQYFGVLTATGFFGALYCYISKNKQLFLLAWFFLGLFLAMPLTSGDNYWRFSFLLALPFGLLSGKFFLEIKQQFGTTNSLLVFALVAILTLQQSAIVAKQALPLYSEKELTELQELKDYSAEKTILARGALVDWLKYFDANVLSAENNFLLQAIGKNAIVVLDKQRKMLEYDQEEQKFFGYFSIEKETNRFLLLKPSNYIGLPAMDFSYSFSQAKPRFSNPVLWLFFPAELFNALQLPFASFLRAIIGLPFSFVFIGLLLAFILRFEKSKNFRFAAFVFVAFLVFLLTIVK